MNRLFWASSLIVLLSLSCQTTPEKLEMARDYFNLGNGYIEQKNYEKAGAYYERALELDPSLNQAVFNLAKTDLETGNFERALKLLSGLEEQDAQNLLVKEMLAFTWYSLGENSKAREYYTDCLALDSVHVRSLYNLSLLEREEENWQASRQYLERLMEVEDDWEHRLLIAELAEAEGETDIAISYYEKLVSDELIALSENKKVFSSMKDIYLEMELYDKAIGVLNEYLESTPPEENGELYFERAKIVLLNLGDVVQGGEYLSEAIAIGFIDEEQLDSLLEEADSLFYNELKNIVDEGLEAQALLESETSSEEEPADQAGSDDKT